MRKSVNRPEYRYVLECLEGVRHEANLTQVELPRKIGRTQAFVSSVECGIRRLDLLQVHDWCRSRGGRMEVLGAMLDKRIGGADTGGAEMGIHSRSS